MPSDDANCVSIAAVGDRLEDITVVDRTGGEDGEQGCRIARDRAREMMEGGGKRRKGLKNLGAICDSVGLSGPMWRACSDAPGLPISSSYLD